MNRNYYIEFRVYLKDEADRVDIDYAADVIQDKLADFVSDELAPPCFTHDVTYEIRRERTYDSLISLVQLPELKEEK